VEELGRPGQLPSDPEAGTDSLAWREIAGRGVVEAVASVNDLADESSSDASATSEELGITATAPLHYRLARTVPCSLAATSVPR
jgi:hypothetical protein